MTVTNRELSESTIRRALSDFVSRRRVDGRRALAVSALFGLLVTVFNAWPREGLSWITLAWAVVATVGAFLTLELTVLGCLVAAAPLRQRREARQEVYRLQDFERKATECQDTLTSVRLRLTRCEGENERLRLIEEVTQELQRDLHGTKMELSRANSEVSSARREIGSLRGSIETLQRENAFLEQDQLQEILHDAASQHHASAQAFAHCALARYQRDAREALSKAAGRVAPEANSFQPYPIGKRKSAQSLLALIVGTRTERKIIRVDAALSLGMNVAERALEVVDKIRPREVHASLILIDELHERTSRKLRSELQGLPRVAVVACRRSGAPYDGRLDEALQHLIDLPKRSETDDAEIERWLEEHRGA